MKANCPECAADVQVPDDALEGEIVNCPDCGLDLEVVKTDGSNIVLKPVEELKEDWGE